MRGYTPVVHDVGGHNGRAQHIHADVVGLELGDHRFDDKLDDLSPAALEKSLAHLKQSRAKLHKEIDAVVISTPDHTHFAATLEAIARDRPTLTLQVPATMKAAPFFTA